jgi:hypothetical protein
MECLDTFHKEWRYHLAEGTLAPGSSWKVMEMYKYIIRCTVHNIKHMNAGCLGVL